MNINKNEKSQSRFSSSQNKRDDGSYQRDYQYSNQDKHKSDYYNQNDYNSGGGRNNKYQDSRNNKKEDHQQYQKYNSQKNEYNDKKRDYNNNEQYYKSSFTKQKNDQYNNQYNTTYLHKPKLEDDYRNKNIHKLKRWQGSNVLSPKTERELQEQSKVFQKDKAFGQLSGMQIDFTSFENNIEVDISANNCQDDKNQQKFKENENDNKRRGHERERSSKKQSHGREKEKYSKYQGIRKSNDKRPSPQEYKSEKSEISNYDSNQIYGNIFINKNKQTSQRDRRKDYQDKDYDYRSNRDKKYYQHDKEKQNDQQNFENFQKKNNTRRSDSSLDQQDHDRSKSRKYYHQRSGFNQDRPFDKSLNIDQMELERKNQKDRIRNEKYHERKSVNSSYSDEPSKKRRRLENYNCKQIFKFQKNQQTEDEQKQNNQEVCLNSSAQEKQLINEEIQRKSTNQKQNIEMKIEDQKPQINLSNLEIPFKDNLFPLIMQGHNQDYDKWKNNFQKLNSINLNHLSQESQKLIENQYKQIYSQQQQNYADLISQDQQKYYNPDYINYLQNENMDLIENLINQKSLNNKGFEQNSISNYQELLMNQQNLSDNLIIQNFNQMNLNIHNDYQKKIDQIIKEINQIGKTENLNNNKQDIFQPDLSQQQEQLIKHYQQLQQNQNNINQFVYANQHNLY